jgi:hypothetical protein
MDVPETQRFIGLKAIVNSVSSGTGSGKQRQVSRVGDFAEFNIPAHRYSAMT